MVSILGCGWLGLPLACHLIEKGINVKGSVTNADIFPVLQERGIAPYQILLSPELSGDDLDEFFRCDILIINFPPERRPDITTYHPAQIQSLIHAIIKYRIPKVLFISSTSVYPDINREVFEYEDLKPEKGSGQALKIVEDLFREQKGFVTTIVRFGGLVGYDRLPGRFLAAKKDAANANAPVNIIHRDDCIEIINHIIQREIWGEVLNACADEHPLRKDYYRQAAIQAGFEPPEFAENRHVSFKIVNSDKLKKRLNFQFKYPDPIKMLGADV
jgi:nucleoside-diphosphate-sugar epimerase